MDSLTLRQLREGEEPSFLALVDGWPFHDDRVGSEFFRKYVEDDSRYAPHNVWVAEAEGRLVSCVQIFPRDLWLGPATVPVGGIGTVFTAPSHRRLGIAERLLEAAATDMRERGMVLSLLSGTRARWYGRLGWEPWPAEMLLLRAAASHTVTRRAPQSGRPDSFRQARDLEAVRELHTEYLQDRPGCLVRSEEDWHSSLRIAGNPDEDFRVARHRGGLTAYLRGTDLGGGWAVTEWARRAGTVEDLADLFVAAAHASRTSRITAPSLHDKELEAALTAAGLELESQPDPRSWETDPKRPVWMLRPLASANLIEWAHSRPSSGTPRSGTPSASLPRPESSGPAAEALRELLPPSRFCFWPADRF